MKTFLASLAIAATAFLTTTTSQAHVELAESTSTAKPMMTIPQNPHEVQLADEIIRRIRRLGVNGLRFPNSRPAETIGEIC